MQREAFKKIEIKYPVDGCWRIFKIKSLIRLRVICSQILTPFEFFFFFFKFETFSLHYFLHFFMRRGGRGVLFLEEFESALVCSIHRFVLVSSALEGPHVPNGVI